MNRKQPIKNVSIVRVELAKDWGHPYANLEIENPKDLASVLKKFLQKTDREVFLTVNLSGINEINSINIVSIGCLTSTTVHPREVFKAAILSNAFRIVIAHNLCGAPHKLCYVELPVMWCSFYWHNAGPHLFTPCF